MPSTSETPIAIPNRYEGATVVRHEGYYYLFVSATNCCNGPLTGYGVFAGRATSVLGPYRDRDGVSLLDSRVGGTPVMTMSGNRWTGAGHNTVLTDFAGRDWTFSHAVDRTDPYFAGLPGFTKRPLLLDAIEWRDGWPAVRSGQGPSDGPQPAPAAQPGEPSVYPLERTPAEESLGPLVEGLSDEFAPAASLRAQWRWVRPPDDPGIYGLTDGTFRFATTPGELFGDENTAPMLTEAAPAGDYTVETRLRLDLPASGCCHNYTQAGLVVSWNDDNYVKLVHVSIFETRQIEFAKELGPVPPNYPRYGNAVLGPPGEWTYLRITKHNRGGEEQYTAYSSRDGVRWTRGATWTHTLGEAARIGLVSMGGAGFTANFDYVRVYSTARIDPAPPPRPLPSPRAAQPLPPVPQPPPPTATALATRAMVPAPPARPVAPAPPGPATISPLPPRR